MVFRLVAFSVTGCGRTGIKSTWFKEGFDWVVNAWTPAHDGSELSIDTSDKRYLRSVIKNFIFYDIFEAELYLSTSRPSTSSIFLNDGVSKGLTVGL